eukprot:5428405-Alexandrium_andersonii.AAC.1
MTIARLNAGVYEPSKRWSGEGRREGREIEIAEQKKVGNYTGPPWWWGGILRKSLMTATKGTCNKKL